MSGAAEPLHLVYGGTFDPIHCGHLAIARAARDALGCTVRLMPAGDPPHRPAPGADAEMRAAMVALAIAGTPGLLLDRSELDRGGRSYTVDTLAGLRHMLGPSAPIAWLVGADSLLGLTAWHRWPMVFELAHLVVAERPGSALDAALPDDLATALAPRWATSPDELRTRPAGRVLRLHQPLSCVSATEVRARLAAGASTEGWLPEPVAAFIHEKGLYGAGSRAPL
ncbi:MULTISPECIES: nicotinate-nucleotide adenylyltransferase [Luteimonas]|uniref:Probable nicotinate-nucleotide adenylyltransferase n=1 Tax=Luteimonas chenhongjianii TaxID=2006110 RepID=A0A290XGK1_9GAMM|nr:MULTISPECIES: nicotinate-nucleotide adenylyltransferase [Luteimonas]ATD68066.1 nicotinic acid mononucleotide adenylyltransferase [Luteimonas chenhongjianii]RPD88270.1 nicotinate-nucleotide adenylyltransferase [Luteimonas sp. 100069]